MFIDNYLESFIKVQDHKNNVKLSIEEARALVFAKASMFFFEGDEITEVYADKAMEFVLPNPLQADNQGVFPVYFTSDNVRVLIQDTRGATIVDNNVDDVPPCAEQADDKGMAGMLMDGVRDGLSKAGFELGAEEE